MKGMKRLAVLMAAALVLCGAACAGSTEEKTLSVTRLEIPGAGDSGAAYPLLTFSDGDEAAYRINADIFSGARIGDYLALLSSLTGSGTGLKMDYLMFPGSAGEALEKGVISVVMYAKGRMPEGRPSQVWYPMVFDLAEGRRITAEDLFYDVDAARERIEGYLEEQVEDTLSDYMENRELVPVPMDSFALCGRGIIFYYDHEALCFLSGWSGEVLVPYSVVADCLGADSPAARFAADAGKAGGEKILSALEAGRLPGFPVTVGEDLEAALERLRTGIDPAWWPGGEAYETEDARMRGALVVSLDGTGKADALVIEDGGTCGLEIGETGRTLWRGMLGEPDETAEIAEGSPLFRALGVGEADIYRRGGYEMLLFSGEDGTLARIMIAETQKGLFE